ncbi:MAG: hypothetical protein U0168_25960 [Nannocystaceae bacterium]
MAPEQHRGGPADARTDWHGLCATLYIAAYGTPPFRGATMADTEAKLHGRP